ncbi:class I SAM-dependent methyltransferase [Candidatus Hydrogenedentota bacterium]
MTEERRQAIRSDYDSDPERFRTGQRATESYSRVGDVHEPVAARLQAEHLEPVLDLGCGEGRLLKLLRARGAAVVGLDNSPTMLAAVPEPKVLSDATAIPFPDGHFGAVAALYMLYHLPDPRAVLAESRRVLRTDGLFVTCAPSRYDNPELADLLPESPPNTFDSENGPDMVREFFADIEVERWDAPLLDLPNTEALLSWLRGYGVSGEDARRVAAQVATPLTLTKRGALIWAYGRSH